MIKTDEVFEMVQNEVVNVLQTQPTVEHLVGDMKKTIITAMTRKGITVDDSINVAAKLIVLAAMVR